MAYFSIHEGGVGLRRQQTTKAHSMFPGLFLAGLIAALAFGLRHLPGVHQISPLILAILIGMAFHNLIGTPAIAKAGVAFSLKRILRIGIVLLGLQLTVQQVIAVGGLGMAVIVARCWPHSPLLLG